MSPGKIAGLDVQVCQKIDRWQGKTVDHLLHVIDQVMILFGVLEDKPGVIDDTCFLVIYT